MRATTACAVLLAALALAWAAGGAGPATATATTFADQAATAAAQGLAAEGAADAKARLCDLARQYAVDLGACKAEAPPESQPLPPEIEAVLRAALRDQTALGGGVASRRSAIARVSDGGPVDPALAAALADPASAGALTGLRPVRERKLSTREVAGLTFGLIFSAAFCGGLVLLASRKERYGRFF